MAGEPAQKTGTDLGAAADRIRETAKWLIVSFAGVGSVLVAGSQLSSLGSLELWSGRFWLAVLGVAVALVAVIVAVNLVSNVLIQDPLSLKTLAMDSSNDTVREIQTELEKDHTLVPDGSLSAFYTEYDNAVTGQRTTYATFRDTKTQDDLRSAQLADAYAQTQSATAQNILAVARLLNVSKEFKKQKTRLVLATVVGAAGVITFAVAANPPDDPAPAPTAVVRPGNAMRIKLSDTGKAVLQERLGAECYTDALRVLALDVSRAGIDVVVLPTSRCNGIRFTLTKQIGSVRTIQR